MRLLRALVLSASAVLLGGAATPPFALEQTSFPAAGTHETILTISTFGRYAIAVSSAQGTALQLVDRMAGPSEVKGAPGAQDGRIDAFLERGTYKIRLIADAHGTGTASLTVSPFTELQPAPVQLVENKPVLADLADDQQRSWWVVIPARGTYEFEAGGRYLQGLRLWQPGAWMVDATPVDAESDADPGRPLALRQLTARLEPGLYRLTAYGGAGLPWANASGAKPFILRWGIPSLSDSGRFFETASPFGEDRFLVPATATDIRLVLDKPDTAQIFAQPFDDNHVFDQSQATEATIDKTSRDPVADVPLETGNTVPWLITVQRRPGAKYRLDVFNNAGGVAGIGAEPGKALLAVTLPGNPDDEIDTGFILLHDSDQKVIASSAIDLDTALPWRRRFNLLGQAQTYLFTSKNIDLTVSGAGVAAQFLVDRFFTQTPPDHIVPLVQGSGYVWTLTPGFYVLSAISKADGQGVLTMSLQAAGGKPPSADSQRLAAPLFQNMTLDPQSGETLYTSLGQSENFGLREETLPTSLSQPLSFEIAAGGTASFPIKVTEPAQLAVTDATGTALGFTLDGQPQSGAATVPPGTHQFSIAGPAAGYREFNLSETPTRLLRATTLPAIPPDATAPPNLREVQPGVPVYLNLARGQSATFALPVQQDALYQLQTTGLLETAGAIRTRVDPALQQAEGNGVGRNVLLQPFLREGDYQLTIQAQGQTMGHAGVSVAATPVTDAGALAPNRPARLTLEPGQAAAYSFHIAAAGTYHIFTLGLGHQFSMRLEDHDGWPLIAPGGAADATMDFAPGDYRMILLPGVVENRAVTMLAPVPPPVTYQGHGPFAVAFGQDMQNRWLEPADGQPRTPDRWNFSLPAPATVTIGIDDGIRAELHRAGGGPTLAVTGNTWTGALPAGDYVINAAAAVPDNRVDYDLTVSTKELLPGQSRDITAPATIPLALGGAAQYEISSFGNQDVRASLFDAAGHLVAANDDRDNDWNFLISGAFPPGAYTLQVDPVGAGSAQTTVSVASPTSVQNPALSPGIPQNFADGQVHVLPIAPPPPGALLLAAAIADVPVELALEANAGAGWQSLAQTGGIDPYVAVPAATGTDYRLRVWSEDHGATPIAVTQVSATGRAATLAAAQHGLALEEVGVGRRDVFLARVTLPQAEILHLANASATLRWGDAAGVALAHGDFDNFATTGGTIWLTDSTPGTITASPADLDHQPVRLALARDETLSLSVTPGMALWQVQGLGGQAGISVDSGSGPRLMAVGGGAGPFTSAVAFQPAGISRPVLHLWQAGSTVDALPITLRRIGFAPATDFTAGTGETDGRSPGGGALTSSLPSGWKRVSLNLPAGIVAVLSQAGVTRTIITGNGTAPDIADTQADTILLLNPNHDAGAFSLQVQPISQPDLRLARFGLLTQYSPSAAVLHIALAGPPAPLRLAGAATAVTAIDAAGDVTTGDVARGGDGGMAIVSVQPGLAVISQDGGASDAIAQNVAAPGSVALSGPSSLLSFAPAGARLIHFETDTPIVLRAGGIPQPFPSGAVANLFQPKAKALDLDILSATGTLSGTARFDAIPAVPITDGLGPKFLIAPGQSRLFTFSLTAPRSIGVGVRGSVDDADVRLLASDGTPLGQGLVLMHDLAPGTYYLAVDVPVDGVATTIQPALAGKTLPDDGPPDDIKAQYLALAGGN
jgi:hypothetical protein